ncbi:unnamed protein product [Allacma fusca]|uniref:NADH-plastoquinone oxidoreductase subunit 6 n=1 Tax=Allacma fusca TaxID=39272 RepID=A0A8J2P4Y0_9HEXA|nr:unnamed protein product [Allacma fusca]
MIQIAGSLLVGVTIVTVSETGLPETNVTVKEPTNVTVEDFILEEKLNKSGSPGRTTRSIVIALELPSELDKANITYQIQNAKRILENLEPALQFAASMALVVGLIQILVASVFILSTFKKDSCHYSKYWNSHYFLLGTLLLICFVVLWSVNESHSNVEDELIKLSEVMSSISKVGVTSDYVKNKYLFYFSITADAGLLYVIGFLTMCCLVEL